MSKQEMLELAAKIEAGLLLARRRMLHEKALHDECVLVQEFGSEIQRIPAKQVIAEHPEFQ